MAQKIRQRKKYIPSRSNKRKMNFWTSVENDNDSEKETMRMKRIHSATGGESENEKKSKKKICHREKF